MRAYAISEPHSYVTYNTHRYVHRVYQLIHDCTSLIASNNNSLQQLLSVKSLQVTTASDHQKMC